jgi:hypothetical protein
MTHPFTREWKFYNALQLSLAFHCLGEHRHGIIVDQ